MTEDFHESLPVATCPNGRLLATKSRLTETFLLEITEIPSGALVATFSSDENPLLVSWRPDAQAILFALPKANGGFAPWIWTFPTSTTPRKIGSIHSPTASSDFAWNPDSTTVAWRAGRHLVTFDPHLPEPRLNRAIALADPQAGYAWSHDGTRLAGCSEIAPDAVTCWSAQGSLRFQVPGARRVVDCAWLSGSDDLLVSVESHHETAQIFRHQPGGFFELIHESEAQILKLFSVGEEPCWHEYAAGVKRPHGKPFHEYHWAPEDDVLVLGRTPGTIHAMVETAHAPRRIERLGSKQRAIVSSGVSAHAPSPILPALVELRTPRGATSFAFWWEAPNASAACIWVEGGPGLCVPPTWNPLLQALLRRGISVLAVNYRGSSGFGVRFRHSGSLQDRAQDLLAGREFLLTHGYNNLVFQASSYGAVLACLAGAGTGIPLVLSALIPTGIPPLTAPPDISAFHGARDPYQSPDEANDCLARISSSRDASSSDMAWTVFPKEGHGFHRPSSLELVRVAICHRLQAAFDPEP